MAVSASLSQLIWFCEVLSGIFCKVIDLLGCTFSMATDFYCEKKFQIKISTQSAALLTPVLNQLVQVGLIELRVIPLIGWALEKILGSYVAYRSGKSEGFKHITFIYI